MERHAGEEIITLLDENNHEHHFILVDMVDVDERSYVVLAPEDSEEGEAYIFRIETIGDEDHLVIVEDDDEFEKVEAVLAELDEDWSGPEK
ncbi:MAG TPA: DUF1292 domain-containing protein [Firmicutes bacterium]|nr:DUF1292 domain-containing protein [Bacillota bacterium]